MRNKLVKLIDFNVKNKLINKWGKKITTNSLTFFIYGISLERERKTF